MQNIILDQASAALIVSFVIEWAKNTKWFPFLKMETVKINRIVALAGSALAALAIHHTFDATSGTLTITGLTLSGIEHGGWEWLRSFIVQEIAYQKLIRVTPPAAAPAMPVMTPAPVTPIAPVTPVQP